MGSVHVEIVTREMIKPSLETPHHLKSYKFSYLDQLAPPAYTPLIFFYQTDELRGLISSNHVQISQKLKQSLSNTLTSCYPLAGRIQDDFVVDCCDAGVEFIEARARFHLMDIVQDPVNLEELKEYVPMDSGEGALFLVQITFFDCGAIAIGIRVSHRIADFASAIAFINAWTATFRGETKISQFSFNLTSYFPPRNFPSSRFWKSFLSNENLATKRFIFDKEKLSALKQAASAITQSGSTHDVKDPTRVELVSAFIWKYVIELAKSKRRPDEGGAAAKKKTFAALHVVNLRRRTNQPELLENAFGNGLIPAVALVSDQGVKEFHELVSELSRSMRRITGDDIAKAESGEKLGNDVLGMFSGIVEGEILDWCQFSSWCRFPVYEMDFGWGKPIWFCTIPMSLKNFVVLIDSKCGEGIEAWVNMSRDKLEVLETQIKHISTNA